MSRQDDFDALETYVAGEQGSFTTFSKNFSKDIPSAEVLASAKCRLQNSRFFFLKISKEIGKAWRKSLTRAYFWRLSPVSLSVFSFVPDLLFDCSSVLEYAKIRTVLQCTLNGTL